MKQSQQKQSGMIGIIIVIAIAVLAVAGVGYYFIKSGKSNTPLIPNYTGTTDQSVVPAASPSASVAPVSNSTDMKVMDSEINSTTVNSVDADFKEMDSSASSL